MQQLLREPYFTSGTINLLGGGPYAGKTTLLRTLLKACLDGKPFLGLETMPFPESWCHIVSDRAQAVFLQSCELAGIPAPTVTTHLWESVPAAEKKHHTQSIRLRGYEYMRDWLEKLFKEWTAAGLLKPGGLVTIDTAMPFIPGPQSYFESWIAAQELRSLAIKYDCILLMVGHAGKYKHMQSAATPWERIQMSMAVIGCTDTTLYICSPIETQQTSEESIDPAAQLVTLKGRLAGSHYWLVKLEIEGGNAYFSQLRELEVAEPEKDGKRGGKRLGSGRPRKVAPEALLEILTTPLEHEQLVSAAVKTWKISTPTAKRLILLALNTGVIQLKENKLIRPESAQEEA